MTESLKFETVPGWEPVEFMKLDRVIDKEPNIHLYSVMHKTAWKLQVRANVPLRKDGGRITGKGERKNYIATASLGRPEMEALRNMIDAALMEGVVVDTPTVEEMSEAIREGIKNGTLVIPNAQDEELVPLSDRGGEEITDLIQVTITPTAVGRVQAEADAIGIFQILLKEGIGAAWMGESGYFIVQAIKPDYLIKWLEVELEKAGIRADVEEGEPF